jgi:signal peptide peptidase SppA
VRQERFFPHGLLAVASSAIGAVFDLTPVEAAISTPAGPCVVPIRGPLLHHWSSAKEEWAFDNYDAIKERVGQALACESVSCVVLAISSPGGLVSGCFETANEIKAMAAKAGKRLVSYVDGQATSAAYALACAGDSIFAPETGVVGSIGVIECLVDTTMLDKAQGLRFDVIASGARKTDTNPHVARSEAAIATTQAHVDSVARVFYAHVSQARGIEIDAVQALEAGCFHGAQAVSLHLVDSLITLDGLLAMLADPAQAQTPGKKPSMASKVAAAIAALAEAAESDDKDESSKAKKMLASYYAGEDVDGDKKDEAKAEEKKDEAPEEEKKDKEASAISAGSGAQAVAFDAGKFREEIRAEVRATAERSRLLASRPDLSAETLASLVKVPVSALPGVLAAIPTAKASTVRDAIAATTGTELSAATNTAEKTESAPRDGYTTESLDIQMGLKASVGEVKHDRNRTSIPTMTPDQARARIAAQKAASK